MRMLLRVLAFVCQVCPFCIMRRRFPDSKFAAGMKRLEKFCPFCRAYDQLEREGSWRRE